jgi:hypothetical protein
VPSKSVSRRDRCPSGIKEEIVQGFVVIGHHICSIVHDPMPPEALLRNAPVGATPTILVKSFVTCSSIPSCRRLQVSSAVNRHPRGTTWHALGQSRSAAGQQQYARIGTGPQSARLLARCCGTVKQRSRSDFAPPESDLLTAEHLGERVARVTQQFVRGRLPAVKGLLSEAS